MLQTMIDIAEKKCLIWASHFRLNKGTPLFDRCLDAGYINKNYDPINTQAFFIETEHFNKQDLQELMQISRAANYATELGFNMFDGGFANKPAFQLTNHSPVEGESIARGKFKFHRGQNIVAGVMLCINNRKHSRGRPMVSFGKDKQTLIYTGMKQSRVYPALHNLMRN